MGIREGLAEERLVQLLQPRIFGTVSPVPEVAVKHAGPHGAKVRDVPDRVLIPFLALVLCIENLAVKLDVMRHKNPGVLKSPV